MEVTKTEELEAEIKLLKTIVEQNNSMLKKLTARRNIPEIAIRKDYLTEEEAAIYLNSTVDYVKKLLKDNGKGPKLTYFQPTQNNKYIPRAELDRFITSGLRFISADERKMMAAIK